MATLGKTPNMNGMDTSTVSRHAAPAPAENPHPTDPTPRAPALVPIREVGVRYRPQILWHLLALDARDRYLRFGYAAGDEQVRRYVEGLDFERDQVFAIFNRKLELIAMAHLAHPDFMAEAGHAEFGVSVAAHARGRGYGSLLFARAATSAINRGVDTLYIQALTENGAMLHIARKAGAEIEHAGSESEARLRLPESTFRTRLDQFLADQVGQMDYWFKHEASTLREMLNGTSPAPARRSRPRH